MESVDYLLSCQCVMRTSLGPRVGVYDAEKTGVVVDGCVRRLEVTEPWRSCGGGCLCVHT